MQIKTNIYQYVEAKIYNYQVWVRNCDPDKLKVQLTSYLKNAKYTILNHVEHHFPVEGYTCVWLLAESHLALHTFPEKGTSYIELSGCNKEKNEHFIKQLSEWMKIQK